MESNCTGKTSKEGGEKKNKTINEGGQESNYTR